LNELIVLANNLNRPIIIVENKSNVEAFTEKLKELPNNLWFEQNVFGETILIRLADKGNLQLVKHILEKANNGKGATTAQVNITNNNGNSAIILTGRSDPQYNKATKQIIEALIKKGAKITDKNNPVEDKHNGQTALDLVRTDNTELNTFILSIVNPPNKGGKRTAKKSRKMRKRKARKTRRVR
jgi:hypothetical protein